jgi:hypothetical protein
MGRIYIGAGVLQRICALQFLRTNIIKNRSRRSRHVLFQSINKYLEGLGTLQNFEHGQPPEIRYYLRHRYGQATERS